VYRNKKKKERRFNGLKKTDLRSLPFRTLGYVNLFVTVYIISLSKSEGVVYGFRLIYFHSPLHIPFFKEGIHTKYKFCCGRLD